MTAAEIAAKLRRAGFIVLDPRGVTKSPAGKSGNPNGPRTGRVGNATSTSGQSGLVTGAGRSKVAGSAPKQTNDVERFAAFAAGPWPSKQTESAEVTPAPLSRAEFMRQAAAGMPADPAAAAEQAVKMARATGLISKAAAAEKLPSATDPGARAVALARQAGVIR